MHCDRHAFYNTKMHKAVILLESTTNSSDRMGLVMIEKRRKNLKILGESNKNSIWFKPLNKLIKFSTHIYKMENSRIIKKYST